MRELLFLAQRIPYPPMKGEKIRSFHFLRHLCAGYKVHLGCLVDEPSDWEHVPLVREMCGESYFAPLHPHRARAACLQGLLTGEPLSVRYFRHRGLAAWVGGLLERRPITAAVICSSAMAQYLLGQPRRPPRLVMDFADVDSDKWRQYAATRRWPMSRIYARESRALLAYDRQVGAAADAGVFVSPAEAALFRTLAPELAGKVVHVNNGVDCAYFAPDPALPNPYRSHGPAVVFTGTMSYWPNVDAVVWFAHEVLPLIRRELPELEFHIVGANPAPGVLALGREPGTTVTGRVPDVRPYLAHAAAVVVPLRIANGVQNKVLEAMAMAKPVVATPRALAGIEADPGRELLAAESAPEFARATIEAVCGRHRDSLGENAREAVLARYQWSANLAAFERLVNGTLEIEQESPDRIVAPAIAI